FFIWIQSLENAEDPFVMLGSDADAIVFEPDFDVAMRRNCADPHARFLAGTDKFDGVPKKIGNALTEEGGMPSYRPQWLFNITLGIRLLQGRKIANYVFDHFFNVYRLQVERRARQSAVS